MEEKAFSSAQSSYRPPTEPIMSQASYPPATRRSDVINEAPLLSGTYKGKYRKGIQANTWTLPPAFNEQGTMLVFPAEINLYNDVFSRWESITLNFIDQPHKVWTKKAKVIAVENVKYKNINLV